MLAALAPLTTTFTLVTTPATHSTSARAVVRMDATPFLADTVVVCGLAAVVAQEFLFSNAGVAKGKSPFETEKPLTLDDVYATMENENVVFDKATSVLSGEGLSVESPRSRLAFEEEQKYVVDGEL